MAHELLRKRHIIGSESVELDGRLLEYDTDKYAELGANILYDSSEAELFTEANPAKVETAVISLEQVEGAEATAGNNELAAAPGAGNRIVVTAFVIQNESDTPLVMVLRSGSTANGWRCLGQNQGDGLTKTLPPGHEWRLNENEALNLQLSDAVTANYSVSYFIEEA